MFHIHTCWSFVTHIVPDNKVHGTNMGPTWGRQDPGRPHVGPMKIAIWGVLVWYTNSNTIHDNVMIKNPFLSALQSLYGNNPTINYYICVAVCLCFSVRYMEVLTKSCSLLLLNCQESGHAVSGDFYVSRPKRDIVVYPSCKVGNLAL